MKSKLINDGDQKTFALIFEAGDEVMENLNSFANDTKLKASQFTAIGAFSDATVGYFDLSVKDYKKIPVKEQVEVLILAGDVTIYEGKAKIHAHVVLGKSDGSTVGGHLVTAIVNPTLEVILTESPSYLKREMNETAGIPLIEI